MTPGGASLRGQRMIGRLAGSKPSQKRASRPSVPFARSATIARSTAAAAHGRVAVHERHEPPVPAHAGGDRAEHGPMTLDDAGRRGRVEQRRVARAGLDEADEALRTGRHDRPLRGPDPRRRARRLGGADRAEDPGAELVERPRARGAATEQDDGVGREVGALSRPRGRTRAAWVARQRARRPSRGPRRAADAAWTSRARTAPAGMRRRSAIARATATSNPRARSTSRPRTTPACSTGSPGASATTSTVGRLAGADGDGASTAGDGASSARPSAGRPSATSATAATTAAVTTTATSPIPPATVTATPRRLMRSPRGRRPPGCRSRRSRRASRRRSG